MGNTHPKYGPDRALRRLEAALQEIHSLALHRDRHPTASTSLAHAPGAREK